jgi:hypothetical protein
MVSSAAKDCLTEMIARQLAIGPDTTARRHVRRAQIGIGGRLAASPLPHHRTYGSVYGGSVDYAGLGAAMEAKPSDLKKTVCKAMLSAGLAANRQGPCGLPAV